MEKRVEELEKFVAEARSEMRAIDVRLSKIETRLDATATKADLQEMANAMIKWIVATAALLGVAAITVMTFVLNNAVPKSSTAAATPIIVTIPAPAPAVPLQR